LSENKTSRKRQEKTRKDNKRQEKTIKDNKRQQKNGAQIFLRGNQKVSLMSDSESGWLMGKLI